MSVFKLAVWLHKGPGIVNFFFVFFELGLTGSALDPCMVFHKISDAGLTCTITTWAKITAFEVKKGY